MSLVDITMCFAWSPARTQSADRVPRPFGSAVGDEATVGDHPGVETSPPPVIGSGIRLCSLLPSVPVTRRLMNPILGLFARANVMRVRSGENVMSVSMSFKSQLTGAAQHRGAIQVEYRARLLVAHARVDVIAVGRERHTAVEGLYLAPRFAYYCRSRCFEATNSPRRQSAARWR